MKSGAYVLTDNTAALKRAIAELTGTQVMVGIPATTAGRSKGAIDNATLGYIHENGSPAANIPARPFLRPGVRNAQAKITQQLRKAGVAALAGNSSGMVRAMTSAGLVAQSSVRAKITDGPFQALSASTLRARRRRGRTGTRPLIDTGQLRRAITFVLRKKGK